MSRTASEVSPAIQPLVGLSNRRPCHHRRIFAGQVQRRLKPAGVRLAVLVAGDQQPLALRRPCVEELPLLRIRLENKICPPILLAVDRRLERLGKL
jgi:hypothetical protein